MRKFFGILLLVSFLFMGTMGIMSAETQAAPVKFTNPIKYNTFSDLVAAITKTAVSIFMPFVVIAFIYAGFLFVMAQGNTEKIKEAKKTMEYSIYGALILLGAEVFAQIIGTTVKTITNI